MNSVSSHLALALLAAAALAAGPAASAEWSPSKPVRMIDGFRRAVRPTSSHARSREDVAKPRTPGHRRQSPGANGVISNELIMRADPDGHTIGFGHIGTLVISPVISKVPYDVQKDLAPLGMLVSLQNIIVVTPSLPAKTVKEYIALAKAKPGDMLYASSGSGSPGHLAAVLLESMTGVKMTHVPYKGGGPAIVDLVAGHLKDNGIDATPSTPAELGRYILAEQKKWTPIIKKSNLKVE